MGGPVAKKKGKKKPEPPKEEENPFLVPRNPDAERKERGLVKAVPVKVPPAEKEKEPPKYSRGRERNREPEPKMNDRISRLGTRWGRGRRGKPKKKKKG